jgi:hypothetical protein
MSQSFNRGKLSFPPFFLPEGNKGQLTNTSFPVPLFSAGNCGCYCYAWYGYAFMNL